MTITAGLFQLDMIDHHAVLGFPLVAEPKQVRKRYLKIARKLHPDSLREATETERKLANELLSKQVNPAYETLTQDKLAKEHKVLLKMKQKQLSADRSIVSINSETAKSLLTAEDVETSYRQTLEKLSAKQFSDLTQVEAVTSEISELNAVYLMRQQKAKPAKSNAPAEATVLQTSQTARQAAPPNPQTNPQTKSPSKPLKARSRSSDIIERYIKRAKEFEAQKDYSRGILEVREAIASHPKSAACHAYLSSLYLKSGQATLAKIHAKQALAFDPDNQTAQTVQAKLETQKASSKKAVSATKNEKQIKSSKRGGGLLSGLFGGKKR